MGQRVNEEIPLKTDLLVIGGSGAASNAAVAAAKSGVDVLLVSKGKVGKSGNAIISTSTLSIDGETAYQLGEKKADRSLTKNALFQTIVKASFYLSEQCLVQDFVEDCGKRVHEFLSLGRAMGKRVRFLAPSGWITANTTVGAVIREQIRRYPNIKIIEDAMVIDLIRSGDRVNGALALDLYNGKFYVIHAKAVIIASGGFQPYSFKCTSSDSTGDGMAMALRAGAELADMEFQLFLPGVALSPPHLKGSIYPFVWFAARLAQPAINTSSGKSVLESADKNIVSLGKNAKLWKLINLYYWTKEMECEGRPGSEEFYFDFSSVKRLSYLKSLLKMNLLLKMLYKGKWRFGGENIRPFHDMIKQGKPWQVGISSEYCMGGILVDEHMKTTLEGLYACGEAASGLYGAFRVESGLSEMLVQGYRAGAEASKYAKESQESKLDSAYLDKIKEQVSELVKDNLHSGRSSYNVYKLWDELRYVADTGLGLVRNESDSGSALSRVRHIGEEKISGLRVSDRSRHYNSELLNLLQLKNVCLCLQASLMCSMARKESRGTHLRSDHVRVYNADFLHRHVISFKGSSLSLRKRSPDLRFMEPSREVYKNIEEYLKKEFF